MNVLLLNAWKGRHDLVFVELQLLDLRRFAITINGQTQSRAWDSTARLAARHKLTSYDAAYLELAARLRLPLATLDRALIQAAGAERIPLFWK